MFQASYLQAPRFTKATAAEAVTEGDNPMPGAVGVGATGFDEPKEDPSTGATTAPPLPPFPDASYTEEFGSTTDKWWSATSKASEHSDNFGTGETKEDPRTRVTTAPPPPDAMVLAVSKSAEDKPDAVTHEVENEDLLRTTGAGELAVSKTAGGAEESQSEATDAQLAANEANSNSFKINEPEKTKKPKNWKKAILFGIGAAITAVGILTAHIGIGYPLIAAGLIIMGYKAEYGKQKSLEYQPELLCVLGKP